MSKLDSSFDYPRGALAESVKRRADGTWSPNTDAWLTDNGLVIKVELSGLRREDLELTIEGNVLRIAGERTDGCRGACSCNFILMEIKYGSFESVIEVPAGYDLGRSKANYENGFLRIDVPKSARPKRKAG